MGACSKQTRIKPVNAGEVSKDPEVQKRLRKMEGRGVRSASCHNWVQEAFVL
jgi:hypothetical protein